MVWSCTSAWQMCCVTLRGNCSNELLWLCVRLAYTISSDLVVDCRYLVMCFVELLHCLVMSKYDSSSSKQALHAFGYILQFEKGRRVRCLDFDFRFCSHCLTIPSHKLAELAASPDRIPQEETEHFPAKGVLPALAVVLCLTLATRACQDMGVCASKPTTKNDGQHPMSDAGTPSVPLAPPSEPRRATAEQKVGHKQHPTFRKSRLTNGSTPAGGGGRCYRTSQRRCATGRAASTVSGERAGTDAEGDREVETGTSSSFRGCSKPVSHQAARA